MWSGPRNLSTALMRSFENRKDTEVYDEPFYAYYLNKTNLDHPMKKEIIQHYSVSQNKIIENITSYIFGTSSTDLHNTAQQTKNTPIHFTYQVASCNGVTLRTLVS